MDIKIANKTLSTLLIFFYLLAAILIFQIIFSKNIYSHSGNTNQGGCHMNYATAEYHCHNRKQTNPYQTYYCVNHNLQQYGPYKSYASCQGAINGSGIIGAYCSVCY